MPEVSAHRRPRKCGDNAVHGSTKKERAHEHDVLEACVLARALAYDKTFREHARQLAEVATGLDLCRQADAIARRYVPYRGRNGGRDAIVRLLLAAASPAPEWWSDPERIPPALVRLLLEHEQLVALKMPAVWAEAPPDELDAERRRTRLLVLEEGAHLVARRGARRCFECGAKLRSATRRARTDYCSLHDRGDATVSDARRRGRENAIREVLDAASGYRRIRRGQKRGERLVSSAKTPPQNGPTKPNTGQTLAKESGGVGIPGL